MISSTRCWKHRNGSLFIAQLFCMPLRGTVCGTFPCPNPPPNPLYTEPPEPSPKEHYQNFIRTWPPSPPQPCQNLPETSQHSVGEERALGKCVEIDFEISYSWTKSAIWSVEVASRAVGMLSPGGHKLQDDIRSEGNGASDPGHSSPADQRTEL